MRSSIRLLLPLLFCILLSPSSHGLTFNLEAGTEDCFYEDVPIGSEISGSFQVRFIDAGSSCICLLTASVQVSLGGFLDIDVKVKIPVINTALLFHLLLFDSFLTSPVPHCLLDFWPRRPHPLFRNPRDREQIFIHGHARGPLQVLPLMQCV